MTTGQETLRHSALLWRWPGNGAAWFFLTIDGQAGEALSATALMHKLETGRRSGWGSVKVTARVGTTEWQTSAFPDRERGWLLPIKKGVRVAEGLSQDDTVSVSLTF